MTFKPLSKDQINTLSRDQIKTVSIGIVRDDGELTILATPVSYTHLRAHET